MKILVTGANGFLGYYLVKQLIEKKYNVLATGRGTNRLPFTSDNNFEYAEMDFTDPYQVYDIFNKYKPEVVIHAGAMGKPDECEENQMEAMNVNSEGTVQLALYAKDYNSFFIYISTDFVFDGEKGMYTEEDEPNPVNYYGKTKLYAEDAVKEYSHDWAIVRTVLVYGKNNTGRNNILTIVKDKLEKREEYSVVNDQVRTPTYVEDLAAGIIAIVEKRATGIYHISGEDVLTPYEMAVKTADHLGLNKDLLKKVTADSFSQLALRPPKTGFNITKAKSVLGFKPISFEEGLKKTFE